MANLTQYADWQVAYGLDDAPGATLLRTPFSILFGVLAVVGARWHWRRDPRSARAIGLLLLSGTLGVVTVLNLRAGPSIGFGVLPPDALHEARERDYFFALGFAAAALWAGAGAVAVAGRLAARREWLGIVVACVPIATNWGAADRRRQPDASLASTLGDALLQSAPRRAVLLLAGDNDSYAIWYQQQALGTRRDVTPITMPLLPARWYRAELARRDTLIDATRVETWAGEGDGLAAIDSAARALGRPLATSAAVPRDVRTRLGGSWSLRGTRLRAQRGRDAARGVAPGIQRRSDRIGNRGDCRSHLATRAGRESVGARSDEPLHPGAALLSRSGHDASHPQCRVTCLDV